MHEMQTTTALYQCDFTGMTGKLIVGQNHGTERHFVNSFFQMYGSLISTRPM